MGAPVRAFTVEVPLRLPNRPSRGPRPRRTREACASPILRGLSRRRRAMLRLAARWGSRHRRARGVAVGRGREMG